MERHAARTAWYCYQGGKFTQPELSMTEMMDICVPFMQEQGMDAGQARKILADFLPTLKRWRGKGEK